MSLLEILKNRPEDILLPNKEVESDALRGLKSALDSVAQDFSPLDSVHINGLKVDQVWVQAQMVLDSVSEKLGSQLEKFAGNDDEDLEASDDPEASDLLENSDESENFDESADDSGSEIGEEPEMPGTVEELHDDYEDSDEANGLDESHDPEEEAEPEQMNTDEQESDESGEEKKADPRNAGLEDFDLAEFQQHVLELEKNGDMEADDEHVDYFAELDDPSDDADMHYEDFFGPAPKRPKTRQVKFAEDADEDANEDAEQGGFLSDEDAKVDDAMETTRKDLFDDEEDIEEPENLSKFERQQQELMQQIEQLENENVGEKSWGMKGEAQAKDRPEDSLFNIQFERNVKPVPVITEEATQTIEELIKERIRKKNFDDIPKRSELSAPAPKRELAELSDQKSQKSLAEQYEEDHMRQENPEYFAKQDTKAMDAAHREVVELFTSVSRRLDALCSWQYRPKEAAPSLTVVSDSPSISMEEAQPGTLAPGDQLAPQELYKSGAAVPMVNEEMTTSLKRKKRRDKAKSKAEKQGTKLSSDPSKRSKEQMFSTLKRGNVTMVDKRGQKRNMRGEEVKDSTPLSAARVKL